MDLCVKCRAELPPAALYCPACGKKQAPEKRKALKRANGTGTVYRLQGRRKRPWVAAKNRVVIGYYAKKTEALEALERLSGVDISERYNMTFAQVFDAWKQEHYQEIGPHGIESYEQAYKVFAPLHGRKFRELRTADFQAVLDAHMGKSHSTVSKYKQLITQMSTWAMREELITTNFARFAKLPEQKKTEKEVFSASDIAKLQADDTEAARIVLMLIYTGMRIGELFSLPRSAYYGTYVIGGEKTEAGRNRIIPIWPEGREHFAYFAYFSSPGGLLLSSYSGQKVAANYRKRDYYQLLDRLGIARKTPHATRHTYASMAVTADIRPELLQKMLGHANYATTANIYQHFDPQELVRAVENR